MRNLCFLLILTSLQVFAQIAQRKDSINPQKLDEIVITGQINPQSVSQWKSGSYTSVGKLALEALGLLWDALGLS